MKDECQANSFPGSAWERTVREAPPRRSFNQFHYWKIFGCQNLQSQKQFIISHFPPSVIIPISCRTIAPRKKFDMIGYSIV
jgi:hypothetical protein